MEIEKKIKDIFTGLLGVDVELEVIKGEKQLSDREMFIQIVTDWCKAWTFQNELFTIYNMEFGEYDTLLYSALENLLILKYGEVKYSVIVSYIYSDLDKAKHALIILDKKEQQYTISSIGDLYDFIITMNDEDFIIGECYTHRNNAIMKYEGNRDKDGQLNCPHITSARTQFYNEGGRFSNDRHDYITSSSEEKQWLSSCIAASKFIPKEEALKPK
ncbi:MAG: hypothetical protein AABY22_19670, partial [Nanoarchaeota archaeon]